MPKTDLKVYLYRDREGKRLIWTPEMPPWGDAVPGFDTGDTVPDGWWHLRTWETVDDYLRWLVDEGRPNKAMRTWLRSEGWLKALVCARCGFAEHDCRCLVTKHAKVKPDTTNIRTVLRYWNGVEWRYVHKVLMDSIRPSFQASIEEVRVRILSEYEGFIGSVEMLK